MTSRSPLQRASSRRAEAARLELAQVGDVGRPAAVVGGRVGRLPERVRDDDRARATSRSRSAGVSAAPASSGFAPRLRVRRPGSAPCQDALAPGVGQPEEQDRDEDEHAHETADEQVAEDDRPEVDEDDLDVEGDEQQGVDVERQAEPAVGVAVRVDARLVGQALVDVAAVPVRDQPRGADRQNTNETPAKANPTTYQMPVNRTPFERRRRACRAAGSRTPGERAGAPTSGAPAPTGILAAERRG